MYTVSENRELWKCFNQSQITLKLCKKVNNGTYDLLKNFKFYDLFFHSFGTYYIHNCSNLVNETAKTNVAVKVFFS